MQSREKEYKNIITRIGITLILFLILFVAFTGATSFIGELLLNLFPRSVGAYIVSDLLGSLAYLASFVLPVPFFYLISSGQKCYSMSLGLTMPKHRPVGSYVALIFGSVSVITAMSTVNALIFPVGEYGADMFSLEFSVPYKVVLAFISTAIVPAFAEELLFRGLIISNLKPYGTSTAVIVSALSFGLMHQNPVQLLYATAAGIVFGYVYVKTRSIWCCIAIHFVNNFISVLQMYFLSKYDEYFISIVFFYVSVILCLVGLICAALLLGKEKSLADKNGQKGYYGRYYNAIQSIAISKSFSVVAKNPAMIIFAAACIAETVTVAVLYMLGVGG